jgi:hypothetical protein
MYLDFKYLNTLPCELQTEYIIHTDKHMKKMKNVHETIKIISQHSEENLSKKDLIQSLNQIKTY